MMPNEKFFDNSWLSCEHYVSVYKQSNVDEMYYSIISKESEHGKINLKLDRLFFSRNDSQQLYLDSHVGYE